MPPDTAGIHEPLFVNAICHGVGIVIFGLLSLLFAVDYNRTRATHHLLPTIASLLALLWNLGSVSLLVRGTTAGFITNALTAMSFSVLTVLPAVLLHIAVGRRQRAVVFSAYALTIVSVAVHGLDAATGSDSYHRAALHLMTFGFAGLTVVSLALDLRNGVLGKGPSRRLATSMCLFLIAISFGHFGAGEESHAWSSEIILHHAGIPLALFVLLQDYRFLMLDAFVRVLSSMGLAGIAVYAALVIERSTGIVQRVSGHPAWEGLLILVACLALAIFAVARNGVQRLLTLVVFGRRDVESAMLHLRRLRAECESAGEYLNRATAWIAEFVEAERWEIADAIDAEWRATSGPFSPSDFQVWRSPDESKWVYAVVPVHVGAESVRFILLGARRGNRRYLSEDFAVLARMAAAVAEESSRYQAIEMKALVTEAELRALQAQINPHFLFNAFNTLYGTIHRDNQDARRLVLNLADVMRGVLGSEQRYVSLEEELRLVRAYLEIEQLRLGGKLTAEIDVAPGVMAVQVPVLSIQPLVENAVKHGVARNPSNGYVRLSAMRTDTGVRIEVTNSGDFVESPNTAGGAGVGLKNVRRRLALCYGESNVLSISSSGGVTTAGFSVPWGTP